MAEDGIGPDLATRTEGEGETFDLPDGLGGIRRGPVLGARSKIRELLGRGGMHRMPGTATRYDARCTPSPPGCAERDP